MKHLRHIVAIFLAGTALLFFSAPAGADLLVEMDNDGTEATLLGAWGTSTAKILYQGDNYRFAFGVGGAMTSQGFWTSPIGYENDGEHCVYAKWSDSPNRATNARYEIDWDGGTIATFAPQTTSFQNQQVDGGTWVRLACSSIGSPGQRPIVRLSNFGVAANRVVIFDGIMITREQVDNNGIIDEPGIEFDNDGDGTALSNAFQTRGSLNLTAPASGFIYAIATGDVDCNTATAWAEIQLRNVTTNTTLADIDVPPSGSATGGVGEGFAVSGVFSVDAGTDNIILQARCSSGIGEIEVVGFTAMYFPRRY